MLPGRSLTGKSTLVAALLRAGASYYSDEYAVLDDQGQVHPYPRRLSLRMAGGQPNRRCSAAELGAATGTRPLPVGQVVLCQFQPGARWRPTPVTPGLGVLALLANTVPARRRPAAALRTLGRLASHARIVEGTRGEAAALLDDLLSP